jgi:putative ABC transport system permease protein
MNTKAAAADRPFLAGARTLLRFALRDLRGGIRGFAVFIACIALGVMAIAGVASVAASLTAGLAREGRTILGGDLSFNLIQREADAQERTFLDTLGRTSVAATMRTMARTADGRTALIEMKAVDDAYPLYGQVTLTPEGPLSAALAQRGDVFGGVADAALLGRLDLKPGDRITVGAATIEIRDTLASEPDKLASGIGFGPRLLVSEAALRSTGLIQPGSLVRWRYRVRLAGEPSDATLRAVTATANERFPQAGWDIRTRTNASPALERNIESFTQYLTLVGLTALLVGGVGVANAVRAHLDRRRDDIATMKALGATGGDVFAIYLAQTLTLAIIGTLPGLILAAALPFLIAWAFGAIIPLPLAPAIYPADLGLALSYGLFTAVTFALWPLGRAHDISVSALFRDEVSPERRWPRRTYVVATIVMVASLAGLAVALAYDKPIAAIFVGSAALVFIALRLVATLVKWMARHAPHARSTILRMALANIHRPGALTTSVVLSLGLGLALLVTVIEIDGNLRRQFMAALPEKAPAFFFVDIQSSEADAFAKFIRAQAPRATLEQVPMLRGRIMAANGIPAEDLKPPPNVAWVLQSDRGITYADEVPAGSRVVEGQWWPPDYQGPPLVSFERKIADGLGLRVGDPVTVNVLGRNINARVANLRAVDWQSLGINFVMVFSPASFRGAPAGQIATLTYPGGGTTDEEVALLKAVADQFPAVTSVRVREALDAVGGLVTNLVGAIRGASALTLVIAVLVLGGALAAGHRQRVYDAVILKTLGATRGRLLLAYGLEYLLIALATALLGIVAGSAAAAMVLTQVMNLSFVWQPLPALAAAGGAVITTVALGLFGTWSALGQKPAPVLRAL